MGAQPPHVYSDVRSSTTFDPRAISRASLQPKMPRPKQDGPLISFNAHPDSYMVVPFGLNQPNPMKASTKKWIKALRIVQLIARLLALLCALGLLVLLILLRGMETSVGWLMRIAPGVATLHSLYGVYHLSRKASGRTPASSASYMLFASFFDVSLLPCYAFGAVVANTKQEGWRTVLTDQALTPIFSKVVFYLFAVGAGLHLLTLALAINLAITFRRITQLPPDMNPLEDNLTARPAHKRNKSSMSTFSQATTTRGSTPLETKRASGSAYEDLSRPPTVPFFHTRTQSTESFNTYKTTPPPSRDSLPSRQYGVQPSNVSNRSSVVDLKRNSYYSPQKQRGSYAELPLSDSPNYQIHASDNEDEKATSFRSSARKPKKERGSEAWYGNDSLTSRSPKKPSMVNGYQPLAQPYDMSSSDISSNFSHHSRAQSNTNTTNFSHNRTRSNSNTPSFHPNPVGANPPTPNKRHFPRGSTVSSHSPLSEITTNARDSSSTYSGDIADNHNHHQHLFPGHGSHSQSQEKVVIKEKETFKAKLYGELKPGTPPVMVGGDLGKRQVSSGVDYNDRRADGNGRKREVSGKVMEEGRGAGASIWGTRLRKVSGVLM